MSSFRNALVSKDRISAGYDHLFVLCDISSHITSVIDLSDYAGLQRQLTLTATLLKLVSCGSNSFAGYDEDVNVSIPLQTLRIPFTFS